MQRKIIVALCGKSAVGKNYYADYLATFLPFAFLGKTIGIVPSVTTRLMREGEKEGKEYFFISDDQYNEMLINGDLMLRTEYRGWCYAIKKTGFVNDINIVIVDPQGIAELENLSDEYDIVSVYLEKDWMARLVNSITREDKLSFEMIRRLIADFFSFIRIKSKHNFAITFDTDILKDDDLTNEVFLKITLIYAGLGKNQ